MQDAWQQDYRHLAGQQEPSYCCQNQVDATVRLMQELIVDLLWPEAEALLFTKSRVLGQKLTELVEVLEDMCI
jgi:hypothetical protein